MPPLPDVQPPLRRSDSTGSRLSAPDCGSSSTLQLPEPTPPAGAGTSTARRQWAARNQVNSSLIEVRGKQQARRQRKDTGLARLQITKPPPLPAAAEVIRGQHAIKVPCNGRTAVYHVGAQGLVPPKDGDDTPWMPPHTARKTRSKQQHLHMLRAPSVGKAISYRDLQIGDIVGCGTQGVVRKAFHRPTGSCFALKEISVAMQATEESLKHLQRELERCCFPGDLCHTMVQSYEAYFINRRSSLNILMEWMDYGSLSDVLEALGRCRNMCSSDSSVGSDLTASVADVGSEVPASAAGIGDSCRAAAGTPPPPATEQGGGKCGLRTVEFVPSLGRMNAEDLSLVAYFGLCGLSQLRQLHQLHNDIKPGNLLLNRHGVVKVADFGVAQWTNSISMAPSGSFGSQLFMAPERIRNQEHTYAADIYSLGLTIAHLAMGRYPLTAPGNKAFFVFAAVAQGEAKVVFPPEMQADPALQQFVWDCMDPEWTKRPSASSLLQHEFIHKFGDPRQREFSFMHVLERYHQQQQAAPGPPAAAAAGPVQGGGAAPAATATAVHDDASSFSSGRASR
eukprot:TRINITY_DN32976_c0_g1_i1.p1 TRINITY_DN32976_c0_g1~~TRINITY_DN32976_c0_g1_i1.p1  ORF type:complete len:565 (+),score=169.49 TRINITY_DN32976_c0_g1_i1:65-1759(+)